MAKIVNLRRQRKRRAREAVRAAADANAARHGESAAERDRRAAEARLHERRHEAHYMEGDGKNDTDDEA